MKTFSNLIILVSFIGFFGCEKVTDNPKVDLYINQLRSGQYTSTELPDFTPSDIPALLQYRNETRIISNFPRNGISSFYAPECKLGMYVLWTIESIRAVEINSVFLIGRFPSLNPILAVKNASELKLVFDDKSHQEASDAYYHWWHSMHIFKDKMNIDPLKDTGYRWH
jgi:hypothetical protein